VSEDYDDYDYNVEITDYNYITSAIGNAFFSGLSFSELWECILVSRSREDLDTAVESTIKLKEIVKEIKNDR
jgi:hypothetical protein